MFFLKSDVNTYGEKEDLSGQNLTTWNSYEWSDFPRGQVKFK